MIPVSVIVISDPITHDITQAFLFTDIVNFTSAVCNVLNMTENFCFLTRRYTHFVKRYLPPEGTEHVK